MLVRMSSACASPARASSLRAPRLLVIAVAAVVAAIATCGVAEAQFSGLLQGTVTDASGGVVPGAAITLRHAETGVSLTATSGGDGGFRFPSLAPGPYRLTVEMTGFRKAERDVQVLTQQTSSLTVPLELATAAEEVSVSAAAPGIDVADSRVHATYREEALRDLPFQGRNFLGLMAIAPGVTGKGAIGGGAPRRADARAPRLVVASPGTPVPRHRSAGAVRHGDDAPVELGDGDLRPGSSSGQRRPPVSACRRPSAGRR